MAESVNAFKSKYTGKQIEELLDVLNAGTSMAPQAGEGQYYTLEQPSPNVSSSWATSCTYETNDMTAIMVGSMYYPSAGCHLCSIFNTNIEHCLWFYGGSTLTFNFKAPINPWRIRYSGGGAMTVQVYNGTSWFTKVNKVSTGIHDITSTNITQIKITFSNSGQWNLYYCILDFLSDNYVHNPTIREIADPVSVVVVEEVMTLEEEV